MNEGDERASERASERGGGGGKEGGIEPDGKRKRDKRRTWSSVRASGVELPLSSVSWEATSDSVMVHAKFCQPPCRAGRHERPL